MYYYPLSEKEQAIAKMQLEAAIYVNRKEIEILTAVSEFLPTYTGQYNKRLETALNEKLAPRFGSYKQQVEYPEPHTRSVNNVIFHFKPYEYGTPGNYQLSFNYVGKTVNKDYGQAGNPFVIMNDYTYKRDSTAADLDQLISEVASSIKYLENTLPKLQANKRQFASLVNKHNKLLKAVEEFNDTIAYPIAEKLRIGK